MQLRYKMLLIMCLSIFSLIVILYATARVILTSSFASLEEQNTRVNIQRTLDNLSEVQSSLLRTATDWSAWNDTYDFVEDVNDGYIEATLLDENISNIKLNYILYINSSDEVVFSKGIDFNNDNKTIPISDSLLERFSKKDPILNHPDPMSSIAGILLLPEGPMMVASKPIVTSKYEGPNTWNPDYGTLP